MEHLLSGIHDENLGLLEEIYQKYQDEPWKQVFSSLENAEDKKPILLARDAVHDDLRIARLLRAYRTYGHLFATFNPIAIEEPKEPWQLALDTLGFTSSDLIKPFPTLGILDMPMASLQDIIAALHGIYCDKIGYEYMELENPGLEKWLQERIEKKHFKSSLTIEQKQMILKQLNRSELFESFIHTKYTGQKRFSLEGAETLIPMMEAIIETGCLLKLEQLVIGMAHRGRLNVLSNILNKSYSEIFTEF